MRAQRADSPQYVWPLGKRTGDHEGRLGSLRVKCTLVDRQQLYPTSANLTDFAVSLNMELGLPVSGGRCRSCSTRSSTG